MKSLYTAVAVGLVSGVAAATGVVYLQQPDAADTEAAPNDFDVNAATDERVRALELAVSEERRARQLLEDELFEMMARLESVPDTPVVMEADPMEDAELQAMLAEAEQSSREEWQADRRQMLIDGGFGAARTDQILTREEELQFEAMQARYDAQNGNPDPEWQAARWNPQAMLRNELGEADYERYLSAQGQPTSVGISSVMSSSPASTAGLQAGDEIIRYDGERVFSSFDLMQRTMTSGGDGQVVVDVLRNGSPIQVVLPRGPMGIQLGNGRRRPGG